MKKILTLVVAAVMGLSASVFAADQAPVTDTKAPVATVHHKPMKKHQKKAPVQKAQAAKKKHQKKVTKKPVHVQQHNAA